MPGGALGAMIAMSPSVTLKGSIRITFKKLIAGGNMTHSTFTGPGEVLLAPPMLGDITNVTLSGGTEWNVGKDAFLACTQGVERDFKRQGIGKAIFSGEGLFVFKVRGVGVMWITSFGAIVKKDVCWKASPFLLSVSSTEHFVNVLFIYSSSKERDILLTMVTLSHGTLSTYWNELLQEASFQVSHREKGSCAGSQGLELSSYRPETQ
jgi:hypothetical protein